MNISSFALVIDKATERNHSMDHFSVNEYGMPQQESNLFLEMGIDVTHPYYTTIVFWTCAQLK